MKEALGLGCSQFKVLALSKHSGIAYEAALEQLQARNIGSRRGRSLYNAAREFWQMPERVAILAVPGASLLNARIPVP